MTPLIACADVQIAYRRSARDRWRLEVPELSLSPSDLLLISGDNMSGKTTLLRFVGGIECGLAFEGNVIKQGEPIAQPEELADLSVVLSTDDEMFPELTILDNIMVGTSKAARLADALPRIEELLERADVFRGRSLDTPLGSLSSGGRAIVKFCRTLISSRPLVLMDEISSFLDDARARLLLTTLVELAKSGRVVMLVSHSARDRRLVSDLYPARYFHLTREPDRSVLAPRQGLNV